MVCGEFECVKNDFHRPLSRGHRTLWTANSREGRYVRLNIREEILSLDLHQDSVESTA